MAQATETAPARSPTLHKTIEVDGLEIFYREAGPKDAPTILLLHGFPTSSHMFRNLIPALSDQFHLVAPDYPGFGNSSMPTTSEFDYTFDHLADVMEHFIDKLGLRTYSLYVMDYGAPIGYRLAVRHPERVQALIVQNGNAYEEGLRDFWEPFRAYWKDRTEKNAAPLKNFLEIDISPHLHIDTLVSQFVWLVMNYQGWINGGRKMIIQKSVLVTDEIYKFCR